MSLRTKKLSGGVALVNLERTYPSLNFLSGDIVSFDGEKYKVKLRGTDETVRLPAGNLEHLLSHDTLGESEKLRMALLDAARSNEDAEHAEHLRQRVQAMELADEFSFLVCHHTMSVEDRWDPLPDDVARKALVRFVEATYVGQHWAFYGRQLTSFYLALEPFYVHRGRGQIECFEAQTTGDIFTWCTDLFEKNIASGRINDANVLFRAFCFVEHRLDFRQATSSDSLLDAFCVAFYCIQVLQGNELRNVEVKQSIRAEFLTHGSQELCFGPDQLLWCFGRSFLKLTIVARRTLDDYSYNILLPHPYGTTILEQSKVADMLIRLRSSSPASHLAAFKSAMDTKDFVLLSGTNTMEEYLISVYQVAEAGKDAADKVGDPLYQYTFHMISAFWLPTTAYASVCGEWHSMREIKSRVKRANQFKRLCESYTPDYLFFQGKQYQGAVLAAVESLPIDDDDKIPPVPSTLYCTVRFCHEYYEPGGKYDMLGQKYSCTNCSKQLLSSRKKCSCGEVQYCNRDCQRQHWKRSHKAECKAKK